MLAEPTNPDRAMLAGPRHICTRHNDRRAHTTDKNSANTIDNNAINATVIGNLSQINVAFDGAK